MDTEIRNPVLRFVVHGHVVLALGAAAQVWWVSELLRLQASPRLLAFVACGTFSVYGAMRLLRMDLPGLAKSPVMQWYRANKRAMIALVCVSALCAAVIGWPMRSGIIGSLWLPGVLAAAYTLPLSLSRGNPIGLRRIPLLKAFLIGFVWSSVIVLLPAFGDPINTPFINPDIWWMVAIWGAFISAIAIAFDVRDLPFDLPSLRTIPQLFGPIGAKVIAIIMLLPMLWLLLIMAVIGYYPIEPDWRLAEVQWEFVLPAIGLALLAIAIAFAKPGRPWWYWSLLLDGSLIVLPLLTFVGDRS